MNPPAKLVAFLALLVAIFGISYATGTQSRALLAPAPTHKSEMVAPADTVEGYTLRAVEATQKPGKDVVVEFAVTAPGGQVISELDEDAGEHMHLIAFRRDLTGYQHITPQQGENTSWWGIFNLTPGPWHVIIHFQSKALGREVALATDFTVSGTYSPKPLPPAADQIQIKDLTVTRTGELSTSADSGSAITVADDGQPVIDLQPAHGEMGHSVLIRPADLGYLHMHSNSTGTGPRLDFLGAVPDQGSYRLFVEFYRGDELYLAPFTHGPGDPVTQLDVSVQTIELDVQGMTCASCAMRIEKKLNRLEGVNATVNYATEKATVHAGKGTTAETLIETIEKTGYHATLPTENLRDPDLELRQLRRRLIICAALSLPVIVISMVPAWQFPWWQWVSFALAGVVVIWGAWPFHRATLLNLQHGNATMDTLISIGTLAAFGWSAYALLFGAAGEIGFTHPFEFRLIRHAPTANLYLEAAVGITTFILLGRYLEARAKRQSGAAVRALLELAPSEVTLLTANGETVVDISQLHVGDRFVVRPGERVATDGVIVSGHSALDASTVTGESVPVEVGPGDAVVGATVNTHGRVVVEATRVGADTQLAQVVRMVEAAQSGKAAVQRLADRVSAVFVPIVIALAVATLGFWLGQGSGLSFAFTSAVAVLIIACPCALGLATPTALLVGTGRGAQLGILIRGPEVLESARHIDTIVLDKTGTVTEGRMAVVAVNAGAGVTTEEVIKAAGSAESGSDHPIAKAITDHARTYGSLDTVSKLHNRPGFGVLAELSESSAPIAQLGSDKSVVVGRVELLEEEGLQISEELREAYAVQQAQGRTAVMVGRGGQARGVIAVADVVKPTSAEAIHNLRWQDLRPVLLTGDHEAAARKVAAEVGIDDVIADVLPEQKVAEVVRLQDAGHRVAMVGDGVNDAAALAQSDLGIALGTGTDAAIHASDLTLISGDLRVAADAVRLSRATLRTIYGNLWWAFAYNIVAIPLAAVGLLNPMIAAAAMALSSVFVVTNSMRLLRFR